jgi:hypothetical protein
VERPGLSPHGSGRAGPLLGRFRLSLARWTAHSSFVRVLPKVARGAGAAQEDRRSSRSISLHRWPPTHPWRGSHVLLASAQELRSGSV